MSEPPEHDDVRDLSLTEDWYASSVEHELRRLPRRMRREMADTIRKALIARPAPEAGYESQEDLSAALGTPVAAAADLISRAERAEPGSISRARRRRGAHLAIIIASALVLFGGAGGAIYWWLSFDPHLVTLSTRVCASVDTDTGCDQTGFVDMSLANMLQVPCAANRPLYVTVQLVADHPVTVTGAMIPGAGGLGNPDFSTRMLRLNSATPWTRPDLSAPTHPASWPMSVGPNSLMPEIHFGLTTCPADGKFGNLYPNLSMILDGFQLTYRALDRDRTAMIPFGEALAVTVPW
ncbi:MAG: hypothetical protein BGO26_12145 [Actinobacteria bacterium 69-20]|nr:hypothetical protein [Actinomycetota bacterium]OJV26642.1 MAG: hypothetical protein BGO26_12145 [Actinobacteria bacterium 69-20]